MTLPKILIIVSVILLGYSMTCAGQYLKVEESTIKIEELIPSSKSYQLYSNPDLHLADRLPHLGYMCVLENRQDRIKKKNMTYRMRLGNLDYVNKLEGK